MDKKKMPGLKWRRLLLFFVIETGLIFTGAIIYFGNRILPGVKVAGVRLGGLTVQEARARLRISMPQVFEKEIEITWDGAKITRTIEKMGIAFLPDETATKAFNVGRKNIWEGIKQVARGGNLGWELSGTYGASQLVEEVAQLVDVPAIEPSLEIVETAGSNKIKVFPGSNGAELDREKLYGDILKIVSMGGEGRIKAPIVAISPMLSEDEVASNQLRAESLLKSSVALKFEREVWTLDGKTILTFMAFPAGWDETKVGSWVETLRQTIDRDPQNALFNFEGGRAVAFKPAVEGVSLDVAELINLLVSKFGELEETSSAVSLDVPVYKTKPAISTEEVNDLGIKELIGVGKSKFAGSIPNRVHNLSLASLKLNGVLVPPGEVFSFNRAVGDISRATGYKEAYIIEKGRTVLGDGGGVCQVSTTLFRALLDGGLPIEERKAHAYRVYYYEQDAKPGMDATVFSPSVDLKFKNDTAGYILIQAVVDRKNLAMTIELYGTSDGRTATVSVPKIFSQTPPPPDLYIDDPTLPIGVVKQIDWKAWGAKVSFNYKVVRGEEILTDRVFVSSYRPWQAVFLRGVRI